MKLYVFDLLLIAEFVDGGYGGTRLFPTFSVETASDVLKKVMFLAVFVDNHVHICLVVMRVY